MVGSGGGAGGAGNAVMGVAGGAGGSGVYVVGGGGGAGGTYWGSKYDKWTLDLITILAKLQLQTAKKAIEPPYITITSGSGFAVNASYVVTGTTGAGAGVAASAIIPKSKKSGI